MSINFHLPDFCGNFRMNLAFADLIKEHPEFFYDDIRIASSYGSFPPALWNGGRAAVGAVRPEFIDRIIKEYNSRGIPIRYTFTNPLITEKDLKDPYCNYITKTAENGLNEIIINVKVLEDYIREKYPMYPLISSTVKQLEDKDALLEELEKDYKLVVLDYNWNNRFEELEQLPCKDKIELLINPYCTPHCRRRRKHYEFLGQLQFGLSQQVFSKSKKNLDDTVFECPNMDMNFFDTVHYQTHISPELLYEKYVPMGYSNFKIEGRLMHAVNILESYIYYLVRPEHKDRLRVDLLRGLLAKAK